jgi:hypothetical protein
VLIIIIGHYLWATASDTALMNIYNCVHTQIGCPLYNYNGALEKHFWESLVGGGGEPWRHDEIWKIRARDHSVIIIPSMATDLIHSIIHLGSVGTPRRETISVIKRAAWLLKYSSVPADAQRASLKSSAGSFLSADDSRARGAFSAHNTRAPTL